MPDNPEIAAGQLDRRVTLLAPVYADEFQDEITGWQPVTDVWAAIAPALGAEDNEAGRTVAVKTIPVVIRYRTDIDERWRIQDGPHTYGIDAIADPLRRRAALTLTCKEVG